MAVDLTSLSSTTSTTSTGVTTSDASVLDKDDFLSLLLVELQNQDPTDPKDSDKILEQTSQLATLEASTNTQETLEDLANTISMSSQFSAISSIGKMASLGSNGITLTEDITTDVTFDVYFPEDASSATVYIKNSAGNTVETIDVTDVSEGVQSFTWDRKDSDGNLVDNADYKIETNYVTASGTESKTAQFGVFPVESVRFTSGEAELKLAGEYIPLSNVSEIYN